MPPSVFRGRVVAPGEPLWLDVDRDEALALLVEEAATCSGCGEPRETALAVESDGSYAAEPVVCHACDALARAARKFSEDNPKQGGVMARITVRPREDAGG